MSLQEVRNRLGVIQAEAEARHEYARTAREQLPRLAKPAPLDAVLATERQRIEKRATEATQLTEKEKTQLAHIAERKRSWNPLTRAVAGRAEAELHGALRSRSAKAVAKAIHAFDEAEAPRIANRVKAEEGRYRQYVDDSLGFESDMRKARIAVHQQIPHVAERIKILERAGVSQIDVHDAMPNPDLNQLATAVDREYRALPEVLRDEAESHVRNEARVHGRSQHAEIERGR
ncbi:MAG TPA: hypothetical protein VGF86_12955 [Candidatus Tumulicola sp.]|jgi:hypothetical protein